MNIKDIIKVNESYYLRESWIHNNNIIGGTLAERYKLNYSSQICIYCKGTFKVINSLYGPNFSTGFPQASKSYWFFSEGGGFVDRTKNPKNYQHLMCRPCFETCKLLPPEL